MRKMVLLKKKKKKDFESNVKIIGLRWRHATINCPVPSQPNGFLGVFCPYHINISLNGVGTLNMVDEAVNLTSESHDSIAQMNYLRKRKKEET